MLREQNASQLAASGLQRNTAEKEDDEANLVSLRQKELQEKMNKVKKYAGSRYVCTYNILFKLFLIAI